MKILLGAIAVLALTACSETNPRYHSRPVFDVDDVAWSTAPGRNSVRGTAVHKTLARSSRTCASLPVRLVPDSSYARLRFHELYGSEEAGESTGPNFNAYGPERSDPRYLNVARVANCDSQGNFSFEGIPDGTWYVLSTDNSRSQHGANPPGSALFKRIQLKDGQAADVTLP